MFSFERNLRDSGLGSICHCVTVEVSGRVDLPHTLRDKLNSSVN